MTTVTPSAQSARVKAQTALVAICHQSVDDLVSGASLPLKQHIRTFVQSNKFNLKDLLLFSDQAHTCSATATATTMSTQATQIEYFIREHWCLNQSTPMPPSILNCTSWENAPVFLQQHHRELGSEAPLALVPIGRLGPLDIWGVALLAEPAIKDEGDRMKGVIENSVVWKYHRLMVIPEKELTSSQIWSSLDDCRNQSLFGDRSLSPHQETPLRFIVPTESLFAQEQQRQGQHDYGHAEDGDDSDDDYWGQYGDSDCDSSSKDTVLFKVPALTQSFSTMSTKVEVEAEDDEDDEYWGKYPERQEEEPIKSECKQGQDSPSSYYSSSEDVLNFVDPDMKPHDAQSGLETKRILATLEGVAIAPPAPAPNLGEVDPSMLTVLLEKLIAKDDYDEEGFPYRSRYQYSEDSCSDYDETEMYDCQNDDDDDDSVSVRMGQEETSSILLVFPEAAQVSNNEQTWGSPSQSQESNCHHISSSSLSSSSLPSPSSAVSSTSTSTSYRSISAGSPYSTASCSDSAFHECDCMDSLSEGPAKISGGCIAHPIDC
ncbi:hypothetical protein BGZ79_002509 [Entomortierella chlamydospora]|nr:hypothetical protein BGZ79_002509 [Entomortierella chlamydospora]